MNVEMRKALLEQLLKAVGKDRIKGFGVELESPESKMEMPEMEGSEEEDEDEMEGKSGVCPTCGAKKMMGKVSK